MLAGGTGGSPALWSEGGSWGGGAAVEEESAWATASWAALWAMAANCAGWRGGAPAGVTAAGGQETAAGRAGGGAPASDNKEAGTASPGPDDAANSSEVAGSAGGTAAKGPVWVGTAACCGSSG